LKQFNAAIEATDILVHRQRMSMLYDAQAAHVGGQGSKEAVGEFNKYVMRINKARKRGR